METLDQRASFLRHSGTGYRLRTPACVYSGARRVSPERSRGSVWSGLWHPPRHEHPRDAQFSIVTGYCESLISHD
jgi:hypothetical protein